MCLRNDVAQYVTWVNKPLLEKLGKSVPATWEEFGQLGAELGPEGYILGSGVTPFLLLGILASSGCDIAIPQDDGSVAIDLSSEPCVKSAKLIDAMRANGSLSQFGAFEPDFIKQAVDGKLGPDRPSVAAVGRSAKAPLHASAKSVRASAVRRGAGRTRTPRHADRRSCAGCRRSRPA